MLFKFLHDLKNDAQLQRQFVADPSAVMKSAGLDDHEIATITSRKVSQISTLIQSQLTGGMGENLLWAAPSPTIEAPVSPASGKAGQEIKAFTIKGTYFTSPMTARIENARTQVQVTGIVVTGAGESTSSLTGTLAIPKGAKGTYTVSITTSNNVSASLPGGFTVKGA
jgi:hypothetical protein